MALDEIVLRPVEDSDLDALFDQMRDPESVWMAAFTSADPGDRAAFDQRMARIRSSTDNLLRAVTRDGVVVGSVGSYVDGDTGHTEVTYWVARTVWGSGVASRALASLLDLVPVRPLHARAASDNVASLHVLRKAGFRDVGTEVAYAAGRGTEVEETILRLD